MKTHRLECALSVAFVAWLALSTLSMFGHPPCSSQASPKEDELEKLLSTIRDTKLQETDPNRVMAAIQQLGELRDPAAVDDLIKLLTFRRWVPWERDPSKAIDFSMPRSRGMIYPAVSALREIGTPSIPAVLKVISTQDADALETQNAMEVIIYLSRDKRAEYVERLREGGARTSSPEAAQRLLKAAETLKQSKR